MAFNYSPKIITSGLVFYLDAANINSYVSGSTKWNDLSREGNNGTLTNGPTFNSSNGGSIVFDGTNDYVIFPDSPSLSITGDMTINCWVKVSNFSSFRGIVSKVNVNIPNPFDYYILISTGKPSLLRGDGINSVPTHWDSFAATNAPQLNIWQNISVTYQAGTVTHYLNSIQNGSGVINPIITDNGGSMYVGNRSDNATPMLGNISCLQLYNRALSATEIQQNYNTTKTRFGL
jgi:hypothetical protein